MHSPRSQSDLVLATNGLWRWTALSPAHTNAQRQGSTPRELPHMRLSIPARGEKPSNQRLGAHPCSRQTTHSRGCRLVGNRQSRCGDPVAVVRPRHGGCVLPPRVVRPIPRWGDLPTIGGDDPLELMLALEFFSGISIPTDVLLPGTSWETDKIVWMYRPKESEISNYLDITVDVVSCVTNEDYTTPGSTSAGTAGQVDSDETKQQTMPLPIRCTCERGCGLARP